MTAGEWQQIELEYITGDSSQRALAGKYHVSRGMIERRAAEREWARKRSEYRGEVLEKGIQKSADIESSKLADLMDAASNLNRFLKEVVTDQELCAMYLPDAKSLRDYASALASMEALTRRFWGILTPQEELERELAACRIKTEKGRTALDKQRLDDLKRQADEDRKDSTIRVVLADELKQWAE